MPRYQYKCNSCDAEITITHSMGEKLKKCPECQKIHTLKKVYSVIRKTTKQNNSKMKVGDRVKKYITDTKKDLQEEKERLKKEEYKA